MIRFLVFLLMFGLGISMAMVWRVMTSNITIPPISMPHARVDSDSSLPFAMHDPCNDYVGFLKEASFVISIPNDYELYIGKERVALVDLTNIANRRLESKLCQCREAYIKAADAVKHRTVVSVIDRLREACVNRIGLVRDKRIHKQTRVNTS